MSLSDELLWHAIELLKDAENTDRASFRDVVLRRSISAAYYALFHRLNGDAASLIAPNVLAPTNYRIQRWFNHAEVKKICEHFLKRKLSPPLLGLIGESASQDLQTVAQSFIQLQDARHSADYDLSQSFTSIQADQFMELSANAIEARDRINDTAEANVFILSLLLWKNWEKER